MVDSSTTSYSALPTGDTKSQTDTTAKGKSVAGQDVDKLYDQLCVRNANPSRHVEDPLQGTIKELINVRKEIELVCEKTEELQAILQEFLDNLRNSTPNRNVFHLLEDFRDEVNGWNPAHEIFTITNRDFDLDCQHSLANNEAILQRTVLISMIDRWRLNKMFTFNCEGHWKMAKLNPLPVPKMVKAIIGGLKADLVLFYRFELFAGVEYDSATAFPDHLKVCAFPDGNTTRCFPFIFVEAKRGEKDLTYAIYCNMLNASQALWNMYKWMEAGDQIDAFFKHVRVFSISLNAEKLIVRVHRAIPYPEQGTLKFVYDDLYSLSHYTRNESSLLIRNLLLEYGLSRLRGYLITAYEYIIQRKLPSLRDIPELWSLPEVRDAVERMEGSLESSAVAEFHEQPDAEVDEAVPTQPESSKRAAPNKPLQGGKHTKAMKRQHLVDPRSSFGASQLSLE